MNVVINDCFGGFGLSHEGVMEYAKIKGIKLYAYVNERKGDGRINFDVCRPYNDLKDAATLIHYYTKKLKKGKHEDSNYFSAHNIERNDPALVETVKRLGSRADGHCAKLKIVEIPDGVEWGIDEYDGQESVEEAHRSWR